MPDSIFYLVAIAALAVWLTGNARRRRALQARQSEGAGGGAVRQGPIPGYSYMSAPAIRFDPNDPPMGLGESWEAVSLETLHAGPRGRVILTIRTQTIPAPTECFSLLKTLAHRLASRTQAGAVAVRLVGDAAADDVVSELVYAPDGRGWTGTASGAELTVSLPGREPFRMAA